MKQKKKTIFKNVYKKVDDIKLLGEKVDVYNLGMEDDYKSWNELYEDYNLEEENVKEKLI